jgi:hypothetical protein
MTFDEILSQVQDLLQREQRVSYRGLKRRFALDDEYIEDLKEELIGAKRIAVDEDGRFIVWTGNQSKGETAKRGKGEQDGPESKVQSQKAQAPDPSPVSYTPAHLAERIRAEQAAIEARGNVDGDAKPSPRCLLTSKARRISSLTLILKKRGPFSIPPCN